MAAPQASDTVAGMAVEAPDGFRCGYIGIVGRPNTGKSSLFNELIGSHISGVSAKAQTTRIQVMGWLNLLEGSERGQLVFLDTPGLLGGDRAKQRHGLKQETMAVFEFAHIILMMVDSRSWCRGDEEFLELLRSNFSGPILLLMNKIDLLGQASQLLPRIADNANRHDWAEIIPMSVRRKSGLDNLVKCVWELLPASPPYYSLDGHALLSTEAVVTEHIREKVYQFLHQEIPYRMQVSLDHIDEDGGTMHIYAIIAADRHHQKAIILGRGGRTLSLIRRRSEHSLGQYFGPELRVFVHLEVKIRPSQPGHGPGGQ